MAKLIAVCTSPRKGMRKVNVGSGKMVREFGLEGDAHGGKWHRQVSLLAMESIKKMQDKGLDVHPGDFAENLTTEGIELFTLPIGTRMSIGETLAEVTQIGKECHAHCAIYEQAGDCVMPREGIFIRVLQGGDIAVEDEIILKDFVTVGVLIASDKCSRSERAEGCKTVIDGFLAEFGGIITDYDVIPDEQELMEQILTEWVDEKHIDVILVAGGTGLSLRDITPEAVKNVITRDVPGIAEAMRAKSMEITDRAMLSRAVAGTREKSLIITLPGSPKAVSEVMPVIAPVLVHATAILRGVAQECARK